MADSNRNRGGSCAIFLPTFFARLPLALIGCVAATLGGCSRGAKLTEVSGHVQVNNQPVAKGILHIQPADGVGPSAEAVITNGDFKVSTTAGPKKVSIQSFKKVGEAPIGGAGGPMAEQSEQTLPPKYSDPAKTELTCDITDSQTPLNFDLQVAAKAAPKP